MKKLLGAAGRAFLRTFGPAILMLAAGILAAPNLDQAKMVGVAGLIALGASIWRAFTAYFPAFTVSKYVSAPWGGWLDAYIQGALGSLAVTVPGILDAPDLDAARALGMAAILGLLAAGAAALQNALTPGETPLPPLGLNPPDPPAA